MALDAREEYILPEVQEWLKKLKCDWDGEKYNKLLLRENLTIQMLTTKNAGAPAKTMILKDFNLGEASTIQTDNFKKAENEYNTMSQLSNVPEVAQVYGSLKYNSEKDKRAHYCILMEYCGDTLKNYIDTKSKDASLEEKLLIMKQLALGLSHIQDDKIVHGDIKPDNVTLKDRKIKIIDFGAALESMSTSAFADVSKTTVISEFTIIYAPPEVLAHRAEVIKKKMDVYCYGKLFYHLVCNRTMGDMEKDYRAYAKHSGGERVAIFTINLEEYKSYLSRFKALEVPKDPSGGVFSKLIGEILTRCLDFDPKQRPTFPDIIEELNKITISPIMSGGLMEEDVKESGYSLLSEINYFNPESKILYSITEKLQADNNFNLRESKTVLEYPVDMKKELAEFSTVTTPSNRIFCFGGSLEKTTLNTIYEIDSKAKKANLLPVTLETARTIPTLAADAKSVFVLGGESSTYDYLSSCELFNYATGKVEAFPSLSEKKVQMAACIAGRYLYVFGGELNDFFDRPDARLVHNYSLVVERINIVEKRPWEIVKVEGLETSEWGGCGMSAAIPYKNSIIIFGGYIFNKLKNDYEADINQVSFDLVKSTFDKITQVESYKVEFFVNNSYVLKGGVIVACSCFPKDPGNQTIYCFNPTFNEWANHCFMA